MPCCHLVGCTGSPVENSNPSKYPIWMSFDWRWEPRAQKSNNHMKRKSSKAEPKSPGGPSSSNTMHSYHSGKLQKKSLPGVEWQTERDSCLKMISLFKTLVNKLQPFNKQTIWWKKESSIVLFHLMSSSLQCRQHSIQYEELPRALHQLFIDLKRLKIHTGSKQQWNLSQPTSADRQLSRKLVTLNSCVAGSRGYSTRYGWLQHLFSSMRIFCSFMLIWESSGLWTCSTEWEL